MSKKKQKSTLETMESKLGELSLQEARSLRETLSILIEALEEEEEDQPEEASSRRGYRELKTINGYGPYVYLRWTEYDADGNRTLKSKYLGRAGKQQET